jgi:hypothetical protein
MIYRLRSWLLIAAVAALIVGPVAVAAANGLLDRVLQANAPRPGQPATEPVQPEPSPECVPPIDRASYDALDHLQLDPDANQTASARMLALFAADQAARLVPTHADPRAFDREDTQRRFDALGYIQSGLILSARDLVYAAFIFQHGDCPEHYLFANKLAQMGLDAGDPDARWIYAATLDRYLMSLGRPQKFGTQYTLRGGELVLYPVDPATTDQERAQYNVPALSEISSVEPAGPGPGTTSRRWLETWWLTLIGAGCAALSAVIALVDPRPNAHLGVAALVTALLIYVVSLIGHFLQVTSFLQGAYPDRQNTWVVVNGVAIVAWFVLAGLEIVRHKRIK